MLYLIQSWGDSSEDTLFTVIGITIGFIIVGGYFALCACIGKYAQNRGRSFWLFAIISIFLNPVIGFIIAALAGESNRYREERIRREVQIQMEEEYRYRQQMQNNQEFNQTPIE